MLHDCTYVEYYIFNLFLKSSRNFWKCGHSKIGLILSDLCSTQRLHFGVLK